MSQKFLNKPGFSHFWERLRVLFGGLDTRVTTLEQSGGEANIIDSISFNGTNVPPDDSKQVSLTEADPTVPAWAKAATKPAYTAQEVGALPANTPIPSKTSDLTNDSGFLTGSTAAGSFTTSDGYTVTVTGGLITSITR